MPREPFLVLGSSLLYIFCCSVEGFSAVEPISHFLLPVSNSWPYSPSATALQVWWFGGAESTEVNQDDESCELVAVRIDRTSPNSRRISGSISIPAPMQDVWAILTDYGSLATHVPNLLESKVVARHSNGEQGDGSYRCRLFQRGAQKMAGFEFGASVTIEMSEKILVSETSASHDNGQERMIGFKCVESFFFAEFDGEWKAKERLSETGYVETELSYVVDVRPKGPVPVAALEWRIREDVPTNLRAVKKASKEVGLEGVIASRKRASPRSFFSTTAASRSNTRTQADANRRAAVRSTAGANPIPLRSQTIRKVDQPVVLALRATEVKKSLPVEVTAKLRRNVLQEAKGRSHLCSLSTKSAPLPFKVTWEVDETMETYLRE